jgi:tetratricopeptide (TPR) repeat protein
MRKWFELVYAMHPAQTPELMKARSAHLKRLFPDRDDAPGDTRRNPDERLEDSVFVAARQGTLDIIDLINNAEGLVNEQRPDLAAELYLQWLDHAKSPLLYAAAFNLGTVLEGVGDYSEAEQAYRRALAHNPLFVHAHFGLALLLERRGNADEAAIHWHWLTQEENGVATSHQGMYEKALAIMEHSKP